MDIDAFQSASFHKHQEEPFFACDPASLPEDDITTDVQIDDLK